MLKRVADGEDVSLLYKDVSDKFKIEEQLGLTDIYHSKEAAGKFRIPYMEYRTVVRRGISLNFSFRILWYSTGLNANSDDGQKCAR
jgi:hypothetical protein